MYQLLLLSQQNSSTSSVHSITSGPQCQPCGRFALPQQANASTQLQVLLQH